MSQQDERENKKEPREGIQVKLFWKVRLEQDCQFLQTPWVFANMMFDSITSDQDVVSPSSFIKIMEAFGQADMNYIAWILFGMMDHKREGKVQQFAMRSVLRKTCACLDAQWLQSYKQAQFAIQATVSFYFNNTPLLDFISFQELCFRAPNDPFLEITIYLASKLDIEGRLFRFEFIDQFRRLMKPLETEGIYGFYYSVQGPLTSKLALIKEQNELMNTGTHSSQQTSGSLFRHPTHFIQSSLLSPFTIYCKGVLLEKVMRDGRPCLIDCNFELRGQELYSKFLLILVTHVEGQEVEGAVMFLLASRAVLIEKGEETIGWRSVFRFDIIYGSQSKTFFSPSQEQHHKWIKAFNMIMKRPEWVIHQTEGREDPEELGIRVERIDKSKLSEQDQERIRVQLDLMMLCRHKHILPLIDCYELPECFLLARPAYEKLQTVVDYTHSRGAQFTETEIKIIISQIGSALFYLKDVGVFHGDIRPDNIIVLREAQRGLHVSIGGRFEAAMLVSAGVEVLTQFRYMAPEQLQIRLAFPFAGDVYSLAITAYELVSGVFPFVQISRTKFLDEMLHREPSFKRDFHKKNISSEGISLCKQMMAKDPKKRLSIEEVLCHKWICGGSLRKARLNPTPRMQFKIFALA